MSKLRYTAAALSLATLTGLSTAQAQNGQPITQQPITQQPITQQPIGQPITQQPGQVTTLPGQPVGTPVNQGERYEANRVASGNAQSQQQGPTVKEALVQKLIKTNEAEIELAKMAQQKTSNDEVKQLASMMIQDHQQLNQTLQQHSGKNSGNAAASRNATNSGNATNSANNRNLTSAGSSQAGSNTVPQELCDIAKLACENSLKMTKDMLGKREGQDFNMAFLGQQIVAHTMTLAELKAIQSTGPQELQEVAGQAATKVEKHLEKAKQLAKKLEDDRKKTQQG